VTDRINGSYMVYTCYNRGVLWYGIIEKNYVKNITFNQIPSNMNCDPFVFKTIFYQATFYRCPSRLLIWTMTTKILAVSISQRE
jgi:hypothetical protein